jgi:hypothetical protein
VAHLLQKSNNLFFELKAAVVTPYCNLQQINPRNVS